MRRLFANLRVFCQSRLIAAIWLFLAFLFYLSALATINGELGAIASMLGLTLVLGIAFGTLQQQIRSRPSAFLLPGHDRLVRSMAVAFSVAVGLVVGLCWAQDAQVFDDQRRLLLLGVGFALGTACCLAGNALGMATHVFLFLAFVPVVALVGSRLHLSRVLGRMAVFHPLPLVLPAAAISAWAWYYIGRRNLARQRILSPSIFPTDLIDLKRAQEVGHRRQQRMTSLNQEQTLNSLAPAFLQGIHRHPSTSPWRYASDLGYQLFGHVTARSLPPWLLLASVFSIWMSYTRAGFMFCMVFPMFFAESLLKGQTPLVTGRRERLLAETVRLLILSACLGAVAWLVTITFNACLWALPVLSTQGLTFKAEALPVRGGLVTLSTVPLWYALRIWWRRPGLKTILCWLPVVFAGALLLQPSTALPAFCWALLPVLTLVLSLVAMRHHFLRRDLV